MIKDMDEAGYIGSRLVVKSDQERAMVRLVEKVCEDRIGESVPMVAPQGHSASNGGRVVDQACEGPGQDDRDVHLSSVSPEVQ